MRKLSCIAFTVGFLVFTAIVQSYASDEDVFSAKIPPDALLVLDISGSMNWTPAGQYMYVSSSASCTSDSTAFYATYDKSNHPKQCEIDAYGTVPKWSNTTCSDPFYRTSGSGHTTNCSRLEIAKRAINDLLDDDKNGTINTFDETSLGIRMGYMSFIDCSSDETSPNYSTGCNRLRVGINDLGTGNYATISSTVNGETSANGGTPLASALNEAKLYLDYSKNNDTLKDCRNKFAILVTDGSDTFACGGSGAETQTDMYKRRRETVAKAKALSDAGYNVFIIGFGTGMPHFLRNTLNWAAYYGKSDNPNDTNSGNPPNGYNIQSGLYYPSGISNCQSSSDTSHNLGDGSHYYAKSNDPGEANIGGYAFFATDPEQLTVALKTIAKYIQERSYSFTSPTIPSIQLVAGDRMYISSFVPKNDTPFWTGNLKAYQLNSDGTIPIGNDGYPDAAMNVWDPSKNGGAGEILKAKIPDSRRILIYVGGSMKELLPANLTDNDLDLGADTANCNAECQKLISYVRGTDTYNVKTDPDPDPYKWKLGDIFHSNTVIVGEPSRFFEEEGFSGTGGFYQTNKDRTKVVIVGANDGMLHAFNAADGGERWAFIPNSLLKSLKSMTSNHTYYVDASPRVADVWVDYNGDNTKTTNEWSTVLVCGLRKGGKQYFALNITDPSQNPSFLWDFPNPNDTTTLAKVGQSWSEPAIGRVKIKQGNNLIERWVAFMGGGFDPNETRTTPATVGKAFFVIDIRDGSIIKEFSASTGVAGMNYSFAAPPTAVDTNSDGFVDKVYIGDLGGQMWVFDVSFNNISQWTGRGLFAAPISSNEKHSIYYQPAVALDRSGKPWVYFGTGDRENPKDFTNQNERFYAVRDDGSGTYPRTESNLYDLILKNYNSFTPVQDQSVCPGCKGWFIKLSKSAISLEKVVAKPVVFNQLVYFTTYTYTESAVPTCSVGGTAKLYVVEYRSGGGALTVDALSDLSGPASDRSEIIGSNAGIPSPPVISVDLKGKASVTIMTTTGQILSQSAFSLGVIKAPLYWREVVR